MGRFDDQYRFSDQDRGYRSDEVRGPTREAWANQPNSQRPEPEESPGGAGGYGNSRNPAWAGQSASLESDVAGRGSYGANGAEGTLGYGRYDQGTEGGRVPSSAVERARDRDGRRGQPPVDGTSRGTGASARSPGEHRTHGRDTVPTHSTDEGYGTRHWGHGEYRGDDHHPDQRSNAGPGFLERAERIGRTVGKFFGVGPKGYRRSDERIHEDVCETLANHHEIDASEIEVSVKDGVVNLSGTVDERRTRRLVEDIIDHLPGIQEIENHLRTKSYVARTEAADQLKLGEVKSADDSTHPTLHS